MKSIRELRGRRDVLRYVSDGAPGDAAPAGEAAGCAPCGTTDTTGADGAADSVEAAL
jgi:hypothetical protein